MTEAKTGNRGTTLRRVEVLYSPRIGDVSTGCENSVYPWERLQRVKEGKMREAGIDLVWNHPSISRDVFERAKATWGWENMICDVNNAIELGYLNAPRLGQILQQEWLIPLLPF